MSKPEGCSPRYEEGRDRVRRSLAETAPDNKIAPRCIAAGPSLIDIKPPTTNAV
ncbi:hypothetical protein JQ596_25465 [Bradyrhizobium manausense]|uniref:hypothetical protein n=1 Tax=Bradyrhizobium TaxID=374 RepID=UPI001BA6A8E3|nr:MULTISPECIES: hypothetical protein [Bradyrhizobium]MBR0828887.1 hypothetical protein [Bradyrhizobium manausense]UVO28104.1 hypothetical protein KUF59_37475 [Bradyrhizobium arachidis]